ncbi:MULTISPECIES: hypothetical protein [unclassified Pseudofrankia]|uniref:hypothetical protein n=1 Tax=unclassified Pseudofrankia TaxID=2994372 RepID=UPI0008DA6731|nr:MULTISPECIES: hypothetical protein [unclassified Pseudofrankia]MDT3438515.1 hypothetical protein [Pseudofrankia sp. BMG5.37]OHV49726.1 hypothetical protein BCD48_12370 [Pseudofrankia sp. BMG5.36]
MAGTDGHWRPDDPAGAPERDHVGSARNPDDPDGPLTRLLTAASGAARRLLARPGGRILVTVGAVVLLAGAGGAVWFATADPPPTGPSCDGAGVVCSRTARFAAQTDPDRAILNLSGAPAVAGAGAVGESYVTTRPVDSLPPPPSGGRDDCAGRAAWAASVGAAQADISPVRLDVSARRDVPVEVLGFAVHIDASRVDEPEGALLTCTGAARPDRYSHPVHQLPQARALARSEAVLLDLARTTSELIPPRPDVAAVTVPPSPRTVEVAPGRTESILVAGLAGGCDCRWRLEVSLVVDGERQVVTVGRDGARLGPADSNPGQPPFRTVSSTMLTPYRYLEGRWQPAELPLGAAQPVCPLLPSTEIAAAFGWQTADSVPFFQTNALESDAVGASGRLARGVSCAWQADPDRYGRGNLDVALLELGDVDAARAEFEAQRALLTSEPALFDCDPGSAAGSLAPVPVPVAGLGDDAVRTPGRLIALAGMKVVHVELCSAPLPDPNQPSPSTPTPPSTTSGVVGDPAALARLARVALAA